jgi:hypothetical protein
MPARSAPSSDVDALFQLPLDQFTAGRNALVAQLKKSGRQAEANDAKALAKPSVSAWVVNQLYWRHRESFDRMIEAGDRLRRAQKSQLTGDSTREPIIARRDAVTALAEIAARILSEGGHGATRDLQRRVMSTLEALSTYGSLRDAPVAGRLTDDLEPPGFDAVAGFLPEGGTRTATVTRLRPRSRTEPTTTRLRPADQPNTIERRDEKEHKEAVAAAKAGVRDAERALTAARKEAERAGTRLDTAAKRAKTLEAEKGRIEKQLAQAAKHADAARQDASDAAAGAAKATQAAEAAGQALELARQRLQETLRSSQD